MIDTKLDSNPFGQEIWPFLHTTPKKYYVKLFNLKNEIL